MITVGVSCVILWCCLIDIAVKQVFKDLDFLGWYNTGELNYESDIQIHKQVLFMFLAFSHSAHFPVLYSVWSIHSNMTGFF